MGLLDNLRAGLGTPQVSQGLLAAGLGTLAANRGGNSALNALGQGGLLGMNAYNASLQAQQQGALNQQRMAIMQQQADEAQATAQMKQLAMQQQMAQQEAYNQAANYLSGMPMGQTGQGAMQGGGGLPAMGGGAMQISNPYAQSVRPGSATAGALAQAGPAAGASQLQQGDGTTPAISGQASGMIQMLSMLPPAKQQQALMLLRTGQADKLADLFKENVQLNSRTGAIIDLDTKQTVGFSPIVQNGMAMTMAQDPQTGQFYQQLLPGALQSQAAIRSMEGSFAPASMLNQATGQRVATTQEWLRQNPGAVLEASPIQQARDTMLNQNFTQQDFNPAIQSGQAAEGQLAQIQALRNLNLQTGTAADVREKRAELMRRFNIPGADYALGDQKIFNNVVATQLMKQLQAQRGVQTEGDAQRAAQTFVQVGNTPHANEYILDMAQAVAEQQKAQQIFYQRGLDFATRNNLPIWQISQEWERAQPSIWQNPVMQKWLPRDERPGNARQGGR